MIRMLFTAALSLFCSSAMAHEPFEITTNARVLPDRVELQITMADSTAGKLCLPGEGDAARLNAAHLETQGQALRECVAGLYAVRDGDSVVSAGEVRLRVTEENDLDAFVIYPAAQTDSLRFEAVHLARLSDPLYGALFTASGKEKFLGQKLLRADDAVLLVEPDVQTAAGWGQFTSFLTLGIEHILTGYDHLLFLAALLIACRRVKSAALIITAFTLAHSVTLALAGLNILTLPGSFVEPAIAATIIFVGIENLWRARGDAEPAGRWALTLAFGLLHGFGFAGALQKSGLPSGSSLVVPLFAFNLGVELGQLAVAAIFLPLMFWLRRHGAFTRVGVPALSVLVAVAGGWWLIERTVL